MLEKFKFASYAVGYWASRTKGELESIEEVQKEILCWLTEESKRTQIVFFARSVGFNSIRRYKPGHTTLQFLSSNGWPRCALLSTKSYLFARKGKLLINSMYSEVFNSNADLELPVKSYDIFGKQRLLWSNTISSCC